VVIRHLFREERETSTSVSAATSLAFNASRTGRVVVTWNGSNVPCIAKLKRETSTPAFAGPLGTRVPVARSAVRAGIGDRISATAVAITTMRAADVPRLRPVFQNLCMKECPDGSTFNTTVRNSGRSGQVPENARGGKNLTVP
jgi:hypothetical protein